MADNYFRFKQFTVFQERSAFKVGTDGVLLGACADVKGVNRILDIGTGTGLIALMLAQRCDARIVAIEPDPESFRQASENVAATSWSGRIDVLNVSLQEYNPGGKKFGLIVSNPPYFRNSLKNPDTRKSAARHDESLSQNELLASVADLLENEGLLQMIMPYAEGSLLVAEAREYGFFCNSMIKIRPLPGSGIKRLILGFTRRNLTIQEKFLTIESGNRHEYTEEYINLTKDFYLRF
jgi:tRNA1Val (adenine37-N6)-methyltransferase